jgi:hypothetical protein
MPKTIVISIVLLCLLIHAHSQTSLIGKWRRINPTLSNKDTTHKQLLPGDLEIRKDSTFHIEGDTTTRNSAIPGWHAGAEDNGRWELHENNRLILWMEPKESKLLLPFVIIDLTRDKLVVRLAFRKNDPEYDITYLRL